MKRRDVLRGVFVFLVCFTMAQVAFGQADTARLQGTVVDAQGAAMNGASVTVTNTGTGVDTNATTNDLGYYSASALPPGHYRIAITQKGFKKVVRELDLQVAQVAVADFSLSLGDVTESITVEAGQPIIDAASSAIGEVVETRQITELPINGRNFTQLATLVPGVSRGVLSGSNSATGYNNNAETFRDGQSGGASLSVNGLRPQTNNFVLDGIDNNEALVNTIVFFPPADAIDEFRVQTSIAPAEFGRAGGAVVVTSLKSGTNEIHGSAFWFNRNTSLNAKDFFTSKGTKTPVFNRNFFGGTAGGPVIKNRLFLFADYEGRRQAEPGSPELATVPTDLMRQGDFSELLCGGAAKCAASTGITNPVTVLDPSTGKQFMGTGAQPNVIPANRINQVGLAFLKAFPEPNCSQATNTNCFSLFHNYVNTRKLIENWDDFDIRGDYILNTSNSFFVRFSRAQTDQTDTTRLATLPSGFGSGTNFNHPRGLSIGWTSTLSKTMINEARVGFIRTFYGYMPPSNGTNLCTQLGIVNCNTPLLGGIALIGGYNNQIEYTGDFGSFLVPQTGLHFNDSLTWTKGKHTAKFGGSILRRQLNLYRPLAGKGYFFLSGNGNGGGGFSPGHVNTGYEVSDLLAGFVDGYEHGTTFGTIGTRTWENGFFAQDDYRVTPRLTLNLGLRYDILTWPVEVENRQANFDLTTGALVVAGSGGAPRTSIPNDYHDFGPRLGFAYQLTGDGKTVLRGGYGLFYFIDRGGISNQLGQNPPFSGANSVSYAQGFRITLSGSLPCEPNCTQAQLISTNATGPLPSGNFTNLNLSAPVGVSVIGLLPGNLTPMVSQYNLQVQREIGTNQSVSFAYVGTHGAHLTRNYNANQPAYGTGLQAFPNLGSVTIQDNRGKSDYNSLQAQYERRFNHGFQFLGSFTWSKTLDDSCGNLDNCAPQVFRNFNLEHALSNQDVPYRLVLSSLYELPFGRGKRLGSNWSRPVDWALGGWQINGVFQTQGGQPFSVTVDGNPSNTRANLTGKASVNAGNLSNYINGNFTVPASTGGVFNAPGTSGRNILRGPGFTNMDFAVFKGFSFTETIKAQFRVQAYNLTNTPYFQNPNADLSQGPANFGHINSTIPSTYRQLELGLRVTF